LPGKTTLAYYKNLQITVVKSFITLAPEQKQKFSDSEMIAKMVLAIVYLLITTLTGYLLYLIVKYLKKKPFGAQFVTDHLSVDLAFTVFTSVAFTSTTVVAREILGPFDEATVKILLVMQQMTATVLSLNNLSIQTALFVNVFFAAR
jgi:hypothetical protein